MTTSASFVDSDYDTMFNQMTTMTMTPWQADTCLGKIVFYLFKQDTSPIFANTVDTIHSELKCSTCKTFMLSYGRLTDSKGDSPFSRGPTIYKKLSDTVAESPYYDISHENLPVVITSSNCVVGNATAVPFTHFHVKFNEVSSLETFGKPLTLVEINQTMTKYLPLLHNAQLKYGESGIHASLDLCLQSLDQVTYGNRFKESTRWFRRHIVENYKTLPIQDKYYVLMKMMFDTPLSRGINEMICTAYHQVTCNILEGLASAQSAYSLKRMLTTRLDPSNYCRPTTAPDENELKVAIDCLKGTGFTIQVMTEEELLTKYDGIKCFTPENEDRGDIISAMQAKLSSLTLKKQTASNFAARSNAQGEFQVNTIMDIIEIAKTTPVEVYGGNPTCLTTYPDTAKDIVIHPHLWIFHNRNTHADFSLDARPNCHDASNSMGCNLVTSCKIYGRNVFFVCKGASPKQSYVCPGYFPEFLSPAYQRKCRVAFESMNKTETLAYPRDGKPPYTFGVGTSIINDEGTLYGSLTFVIKGKSYSVSKLK